MTATYPRITLMSLLVLLSVGCGSNPALKTPPKASCTPSTKPEFAYLLNGPTVSSYTVNSCTGAFTATTPGTVATDSTANQPGSEAMAVDPLGRFVYVANLVSNASDKATISMYTINQTTGVLTATSPATVHAGFFPQGIGIDPSGRFVYTANSDDNTISMFSINQTTGVLTPTVPATVATGSGPLSITFHPSGKFAYVANQDDDTISMYTVNQTTGVLTAMSPATVGSFGSSPFGVFLDPAGRFAYVPDAYSADNRVAIFNIDQTTGALVQNQQAIALSGNNPTAVAVDPSGKYAYVVDRQANAVSMYGIDQATGNLTTLGTGTVSTGTQPFRIVVDPSGKFVYVANEDGAASVFTIAADGTLNSSGSAMAVGSSSLDVGVTAVK